MISWWLTLPTPSLTTASRRLKTHSIISGFLSRKRKLKGQYTISIFLASISTAISGKRHCPQTNCHISRKLLLSYAVMSTHLTKPELLSLLGHLSLALRIIRQGHSFIARLLELSKSVSKLHDKIQLDVDLICVFWLLREKLNGI